MSKHFKHSYQPTPDLHLDNGIYTTSIDGLYYIKHQPHQDKRGFYSELARIPEIDSHLVKPFTIKQFNHSHSVANSIRGFHAESWRKLITITHGWAMSVLVDIRTGSKTFLKKEQFILGYSEHALTGSLFVLEGIANSFCVTEGEVDYIYSVDQLYRDRNTSGDQAVSLFDPDIGVTWPLDKDKMIISDRDQNATTLRQLHPEKFSQTTPNFTDN